MSVVDQLVWLAAGRVRRLLVRVLLVLGGAFVVTVLGWLLCANSASADELPSVPSVPSAPSVLDGLGKAVGTPVSTPDIKTPSLPSNPLSDNPLPDPGLGKVTQQVHQAVAGVGERATPVVEPVVAAAPESQSKPAPPVTPRQASTRSAAPSIRSAVPAAPIQHLHVVTVQRPTGQRTASKPSGATRHTPVLPPSQPAGSSDSSAHGTGGSTDGSGGAQAPVAASIGDGLNLAGPPSTPRLAVAPGQQPGTSPD